MENPQERNFWTAVIVLLYVFVALFISRTYDASGLAGWLLVAGLVFIILLAMMWSGY